MVENHIRKLKTFTKNEQKINKRRLKRVCRMSDIRRRPLLGLFDFSLIAYCFRSNARFSSRRRFHLNVSYPRKH